MATAIAASALSTSCASLCWRDCASGVVILPSWPAPVPLAVRPTATFTVYASPGATAVLLGVAVTVPAIWLMSYATAYWHFLAIGLFVGLAGGSFSVGTPYVARWFPKNKQGMAMGVYGAGNSGSAVNKFVAPVILVAFGWAAVPQAYAAIMAATVVLFWLFSHSDPAHLVPSQVSFTDQLKALKDPRVLKYCQYYSIVFGGYVALALWMVQYYIGEYGLDIRVAALLAACFSLPGGVLRAVGGVLSDKYGAHNVTWWVMWVSWICLFLLSYPQTEFTIATVTGPKTFVIGLNVYAFTGLMFILGIAFAFGKASVFKYIANDYPGNIGAISGIVGDRFVAVYQDNSTPGDPSNVMARILDPRLDSAGDPIVLNGEGLLLIGDPDKDGAAIDAVSPARLADRFKAPVLLIHGNDDTTVPPVSREWKNSCSSTSAAWVWWPARS